MIVESSAPITAGQSQIVLRPNRRPDRPRYGLLYTHGAGSGPDAMMNYGNAMYRSHIVADAGITAVSADYGGPHTWGNSAAMEAMTDAYNWLQTQPGVKPGKVMLAGGSMGGLNALIWASENPGKVAAISTYIPVINPSEIHDRDLGGYAGLIRGAHGGSWNAETRERRDPLYIAQHSSKYAGIPIRIHYGLQDVLCLPDNVPAFQAAVGGNLVTINGVNGGHEEATELKINREQERDWLLSYST